MTKTIESESLKSADILIEDIKSLGDYTPYRKDIAKELYENGLFSGNWDSVYNPPEGTGLKAIRLIEENEYDQSMPKDEKPDWDDIICQTSGGYVLLA